MRMIVFLLELIVFCLTVQLAPSTAKTPPRAMIHGRYVEGLAEEIDKLKEWRQWMTMSLSFLDRTILKRFRSSIYQKRRYIAYIFTTMGLNQWRMPMLVHSVGYEVGIWWRWMMSMNGIF